MSKPPEFADTPTDREALAAILTAAGRSHSPADDLAAMNAGWDQLAVGLAAAPEAEFDGWEARLKLALAERPEARARADELAAHLIGWRLGDV